MRHFETKFNLYYLIFMPKLYNSIKIDQGLKIGLRDPDRSEWFVDMTYDRNKRTCRKLGLKYQESNKKNKEEAIVAGKNFYLNFLKEKEENLDVKMSLPARLIAGIVSGFISAPMGIGGAVMNVPILKFFGYPINKAIGSAAAIGFIIALFGAVGFLISGSYLNAQLPLSIGFLNIPAFLIFFPITAFMARLGAKASHRINKKKMTKYFGLFLVFIGTRFLYEYFSL